MKQRDGKTREGVEAEIDAALVALTALGLAEEVEGGYRAAVREGPGDGGEEGKGRGAPMI